MKVTACRSVLFKEQSCLSLALGKPEQENTLPISLGSLSSLIAETVHEKRGMIYGEFLWRSVLFKEWSFLTLWTRLQRSQQGI